ncbi:hypothetical protein ACFPTY_11740 [Halomonas beimenensis]|uniref:hypothetical protein n=1 Tax=Halomonas beimenensis TaxID=475662 RepID=UPI00360C3B97
MVGFINLLKSFSRMFSKFCFLSLIFVLVILLILELIALSSLVSNSVGQLVNDIFEKNMLVPLTVVMATTVFTKGAKNLRSLVSGFSLLYICAFYLYIDYRFDPMEDPQDYFLGWVYFFAGETFFNLMALVNKFGFTVGCFGLITSLYDITLDHEVYKIKEGKSKGGNSEKSYRGRKGK